MAASLFDVAEGRSVAKGSVDRISFSVVDAAACTDPRPFNVVLWNQFLFTGASRPKSSPTPTHGRGRETF
ncbi:hypothetical protein [Actinoplanes sp. NBRC 103695]|uniref:hypothetical protein n=1 Tax=Actinoplanes sp. NBRC 103695 TaxID=3032202 RepID=UPI002552E5C8|nr:hypothetical protein [Actinoplanes sp. NBRC 103695]